MCREMVGTESTGPCPGGVPAPRRTLAGDGAVHAQWSPAAAADPRLREVGGVGSQRGTVPDPEAAGMLGVNGG